ncbi:MAG: RtcB family protein [Gammaproteobacteria bacterium]|nr:MAG: RtcB family protein [Gammaproteobacteria bacterium]
MPVYTEYNKGTVPVKVYTNEIEYGAIDQLINLSKLPFIHSHIAAMPDVHCGKGATVGTVIPTIDTIIPAAVGVDIGCGMQAVRLNLMKDDLPNQKKMARLRSRVEEMVPIGFYKHSYKDAPKKACKPLDDSLDNIISKHPELMKMVKNLPHTWVRQMGTLGGGNHFIEICFDDDNQLWVMLHTGSRGIGNAMGKYFSALARRIKPKDVRLPHKELAFFSKEDDYFNDYLFAVNWAQDYARTNRDQIMKSVLEVVSKEFKKMSLNGDIIDCHHNYVAREHHFGKDVYITRKGAISAKEGEPGIVPGSMGAKSFIVSGKGNAESFCSSAHGAGRKMSRSAARKRFRRSDLEIQTRGIECRKDSEVIDEIPAAYKSIDSVMDKQSDLVSIKHQLKQVLCIKG